MIKRFMLYSTLLLIAAACKKEKIEAKPPYVTQWWDRYYGTYTVTDTAADFSYQMEIVPIERYYEGVLTRDSVLIKNVKNKFDLRLAFVQNIPWMLGFPFGIHHPIKDREGNRWMFSCSLRETEMEGAFDLDYSLSNIAYHFEDGTELHQCILCTDLVTKNP